MNVENNKNQNNDALWLGVVLVGGVFVIWWIKNELDKRKKELEIHLAKQTEELAQVKLEREQELKKIQKLEQQLVKLENLNKKGNHPSWGSSFLWNLVGYLGKLVQKKISGILS